MTLGHQDAVRRARLLFDEVLVGVAVHDSKRPLLSLEDRLEAARLTVRGLAGVTVVALPGILVEEARQHGASVIVRGLRSSGDLDYERPMVLTNRTLAPEIETVFVLPDPTLAHISSTLVRQLARLGAPLDAFVVPAVADLLRRAAKAEIPPDSCQA